MTALTEWQNFYMIVGSSAGALIGLQFVVLTLVASLSRTQTEGGAAFVTPTIVHFGTVLLLAGVMSAPWQSMEPAMALWCAMGLAGALYTSFNARRLGRQTVYTPQFEDWIFHAVLPLVAYLMLVAAAGAEALYARVGLFDVGAAALFLLFIGIHNAWDTVTYHVFTKS
ncbi:MAG: hypothetical protein KGJ51_04200 [Acidobacteriota bacterium]|nr:hypothetical protein [Acidobacteriota bacterium]